MTDLMITSSTAIALPAPRVDLSIRTGTMDDLAFIDGLQKAHTKQLGWMPRQQLEEKIKAGHVLIAEEGLTADGADHTDNESNSSVISVLSAVQHPVGCVPSVPDTGRMPVPHKPVPLGYIISRDQYMKRDDVGIIYQLGVVPGMRRSLVGAALVKGVFERAAYGCRLFCCWCAQDIEANRFWEAMGFVPLAFRAGGRARRAKDEGGRMKDEKERMKRQGGATSSSFIPHASSFRGRVHIFWQRRVRAGDTITPWWFPCQTTGGSIREDRLVFPIPPGMHWSDEMPVILPEGQESSKEQAPSSRAITGPRSKAPMRKVVVQGSRYKLTGFKLLVKGETPGKELAGQSKRREKPPKARLDPVLATKARELRDRWLEQVNAGGAVLEWAGKYDVGRLAA